ncbi:MAG: Ig-like domain-containing protein [Clostridia bacterium]|nr:Ig-like domain-containing protein [Clostridia bacterium]
MKKRFLSLLLSVVFVMGMLPVMSLTVSASATEYFADDFEDYTVGTKWEDSSAVVEIKNNDGVSKWNLPRGLRTEIVSVPGYDGKTTNAMKVQVSVANNSSGSYYRMSPVASAYTPTGIYVVEFKVFNNLENRSMYWRLDPFRANVGDSQYYTFCGTTVADAVSGWLSVRYVIDASKDETILYINDKLVSYKTISQTSHAFPSYLTFEKNKQADTQLYIDDFNWYYLPDTTAAASTSPADTEENVSKAATPAVTFNNEILDDVIGSDATLSTENVEIVKKEDNSTVAVSSANLSADGKTVTATPASDLEYGKEYQVTFKNLTDIYGREVASVSYSFTTLEQPQLSFSDVAFKKEALATDGEAITTLENGYISCEFSITNNHATKTQKAVLIAVLWENNAIKSFQFLKANLGYNETANFYGGFNVTDAENSKIETYIWDDIKTMVPLCEKTEFTKTGINN